MRRVIVLFIACILAIGLAYYTWFYISEDSNIVIEGNRTYILNSTEGYSVSLSSIQTYEENNSVFISFDVKREEGSAEPTGFYVVLGDSDGKSTSYKVYLDEELEENETKTLVINY